MSPSSVPFFHVGRWSSSTSLDGRRDSSFSPVIRSGFGPSRIWRKQKCALSTAKWAQVPGVCSIVSWEKRALRRARCTGTSGSPQDILRLRKPCRWVLLTRSEEHTSELQSHHELVCRLL